MDLTRSVRAAHQEDRGVTADQLVFALHNLSRNNSYVGQLGIHTGSALGLIEVRSSTRSLSSRDAPERLNVAKLSTG